MEKAYVKEVNRLKKNKNHIMLLLFFIFIFSFFISFHIGRYPIKANVVIKVFLSKIFSISQTWEQEVETIIFNIRLPRIMAGILIGAALSVSGATFQVLFRNPMVSPGILGASSSAGFGAALGIYLQATYIIITGMSFLISMIGVVITWLLGKKYKGDKILGLILSGIMVGSLFSSATSFLKLIADTENTLPAITYWLMGSLTSIRMEDIKFIIFPIVLGFVPLYVLRWRLNTFTMGENEAMAMGANTKLLRIISITSATIMTAASVSVAGLIGWVGLVIPHLTRLVIGNDYRYVIPASAIMGATFLLMVDNIARTISTMEIPIGILTSFIGVPFFLFLIMKGGRNASYKN